MKPVKVIPTGDFESRYELWFLSWHYEEWDFYCREMCDMLAEVAQFIAPIKAGLHRRVNELSLLMEETNRLLKKYDGS